MAAPAPRHFGGLAVRWLTARDSLAEFAKVAEHMRREWRTMPGNRDREVLPGMCSSQLGGLREFVWVICARGGYSHWVVWHTWLVVGLVYADTIFEECVRQAKGGCGTVCRAAGR